MKGNTCLRFMGDHQPHPWTMGLCARHIRLCLWPLLQKEEKKKKNGAEGKGPEVIHTKLKGPETWSLPEYP